MAIWNILAEKLDMESREYVAKQWKHIRDLFVKMDNTACKSGSGAYVPSSHRKTLIWEQANFCKKQFKSHD